MLKCLTLINYRRIISVGRSSKTQLFFIYTTYSKQYKKQVNRCTERKLASKKDINTIKIQKNFARSYRPDIDIFFVVRLLSSPK